MSASHFFQIFEEVWRKTLQACGEIWTYLTNLPVNWQAVTGTATSLYTLFVLLTLFYIHRQLKAAQNNNKLQAALTVFKEIQTTRARDAMRKLYKQVPVEVVGLGDEELEKYLEIAQAAILPFDRIGFLIQEGHTDSDPIIVLCWALVWRSWKRAENIINWAREKRGEPTYLRCFKYLFDLAEAYRIENNLQEPRIH